MTPEQRRKNLYTAIGLVIVVIGIMAWAFWRAGNGGLGGN
jgi:Mg2+ and Co2+ transporter CorA